MDTTVSSTDLQASVQNSIDELITKLTKLNPLNLKIKELASHYSNGDESKMNDTDFSGASLFDINMSAYLIEKSDFQNTEISSVKFNKSKLRKADFSSSMIKDTCFDDADLRQASFVGVTCVNTNPKSQVNQVENGGGSMPMTRVSFKNADLRGADLTDANLSYVDFTGANLEGAMLCGANLHGADFTNAKLKDANLSWADMSETITTGTILKCDFRLNL